MTYRLICGSVLKEEKSDLVRTINESELDGFEAISVSAISESKSVCVLMHLISEVKSEGE